MTIASVPSTLLREPQRFIDEVKAGKGLSSKAATLIAVCFLFFGAYGAVIGASSSWAQSFVSVGKLPLLFLLTLVICLPVLQMLEVVFGARHTSGQLVVLLLGAFAATATILAAFLPIVAFFMVSNDSYSFFKLLNVSILAVSAFFGVRFFAWGLRRLNLGESEQLARSRDSVLRMWILLYGFVGCQLAWVMRPFFGAPGMEFELFRTERGNFVLDIVRAVREVTGMG